MGDISTWSTTAADNNQATPDGWPENQSPSSVNNCAREDKAAVRRWYEDAEWINFGFTVSQIDSTNFKVDSATSTAVDWFRTDRRLRLHDGSSTFYGSVEETSKSASSTNVKVNLDSGALTASLSAVDAGIISGSNTSLPSNLSGFELIDEQNVTATATANINFTGLGTNTNFFGFKWVIDYLHPATNQVAFRIKTSTNNGSTFDGTSYVSLNTLNANSTGIIRVTGSGAQIVAVPAAGNAANKGGVWGEVTVLNPKDSSRFTNFVWNLWGNDSVGKPYTVSGGGRREVAEAVNAVQFRFSSGKISKAKIRLYGLYDS